MKILNLYCGIGGNRKLWGNDHEITAVEKEQYIADIYQDIFPDDTVIVGDAHQYLLEHYSEFDFVWGSPPCPTHSRTNYFLNSQGVIRYPDMVLYQEILLLDNFFKGKYVIENVISYYEPLIKPVQIGRHYFWSNFKLPLISQDKKSIGKMCGKNQTASKKHITERNAVNSELGLAILESALNIYNHNKATQIGLFKQD